MCERYGLPYNTAPEPAVRHRRRQDPPPRLAHGGLTGPAPATMAPMTTLTEARVKGTVEVEPGRVLSFAEFGVPSDRVLVWLHGTPGPRADPRGRPGDGQPGRRARHRHRPSRDRPVHVPRLRVRLDVHRRPRGGARLAGGRTPAVVGLSAAARSRSPPAHGCPVACTRSARSAGSHRCWAPTPPKAGSCRSPGSPSRCSASPGCPSASA